MAMPCQIKIEVKYWYMMMSKVHLALPSIFFTLMWTIVGCSIGKLSGPWGLQSDLPDVYRFYEGPEIPIEKLATLDIQSPVAIKFDGNYYSGKFAVTPGEKTIDLWYAESVEGRRRSSLRSVVPTTFSAVAGRRYKALSNDFFDVTNVPPNYWHPEIMDITEDSALSKLVREPTNLGVAKGQEPKINSAAKSKLIAQNFTANSRHTRGRETKSWRALPTSEVAKLNVFTKTDNDRQSNKNLTEDKKIRKFYPHTSRRRPESVQTPLLLAPNHWRH